MLSNERNLSGHKRSLSEISGQPPPTREELSELESPLNPLLGGFSEFQGEGQNDFEPMPFFVDTPYSQPSPFQEQPPTSPSIFTPQAQTGFVFQDQSPTLNGPETQSPFSFHPESLFGQSQTNAFSPYDQSIPDPFQSNESSQGFQFGGTPNPFLNESQPESPFSFGGSSPNPFLNESQPESPFSLGDSSPNLFLDENEPQSLFSFGDSSPNPFLHGSQPESPFSFGDSSSNPFLNESQPESPFSFGGSSPNPFLNESQPESPFSFGDSSPNPFMASKGNTPPVSPLPLPQTLAPPQNPALEFTDLLGTKGASQQGQISRVHGKTYEGPISMAGRRAEQLQRHLSNLVLNALNPLKDTDETWDKPVEIQSSLVGKKLMLNSNNRSSEVQLSAMLNRAGNLHQLTMGDRAKNPALDKDMARPLRYQSKITKALGGQRQWQQTVENARDQTSGNRILQAMQGNVTTLDPNDSNFKTDLAAFKQDRETPGVLVVLHSKNDLNEDSEHAERVQSRFRTAYLGELEDEFSTKPAGPKTPCFGCQVHHDVNYSELADENGLSGAYFDSGSPVSTPAEKARAIQLAQTRPATGSVSQNGYLRNSDYPDSDSDDDGNQLDFMPATVHLGFDEAPGDRSIWKMDGDDISIPKSRNKSGINRPYLEKTKKRNDKAARKKTPNAFI